MSVSADPVVDLFVAETPGDAARTLLVVHGGPDWDQMYLREPLVQLAGTHRVVFVDLRGCGRSTRGLPRHAYTPAAAAADLAVLVDHLVDGPVDVLGFSYGGLLVQRLIAQAPELVRSAVIASSSVLPVPVHAFDGWAERDRRLAAIQQTPIDGEHGPDRTRMDAIRSAGRDLWRLDLLPQYLARLEQVWFSADWSQAWPDRSSRPPARPDHAVDRLREAGMPLLLLHGRHDMTFPVALVEATLAVLPNAEAVVLDQAGHMAHVDQPEAWLAAVQQFLEQPRCLASPRRLTTE